MQYMWLFVFVKGHWFSRLLHSITFLIIVSMCVSSISNKNKISINCWIIYNLITSFHTVCMFLVNIGNHHDSFLSYDDGTQF